MNLVEDLKMLVAVAQAGGVRDGAKRVFKTQPAVSQALKRLENELNIEIYDRKHYRFSLTDQGRALLKRAERLLSEEDRFKSYAIHLNSGVEISLHFAAQSSVDPGFYLDVLKEAQMLFPDTTFHIHQEEVRGATNLVMDEIVDLAINPWSPLSPSSHELETLILGQFELINVCHHLYAESNDQAIPSSLAADWHQIVLTLDAKPSDDLFDVIEGNRRWYCNTQAMKDELIRSGMGWGKLQKKAIAHLLESGELVELNIEGIKNQVIGEYHLMRRKKKQQGPIAQWLWKRFLDRERGRDS